jgi:hypothetical protein
MTVNKVDFSRFVTFGDRSMKESTPTLGRRDLAELLERARRACEEAMKLSDDHRFIVSWYRMRPRFAMRSSSLLDGED